MHDVESTAPSGPQDDEDRAAPVFAYLADLGIPVETARHEAVFTVEQSRHLRGIIPGGHVKNLFLKDKKGRLFLVVAEEETRIDLKRLHEAIGASGRLSFCSAETLRAVLGVEPGSVTPLSVLNDRDGLVTVVLDTVLMTHEPINVHPLVNTMTTSIAREDLLRFLRATGHEPLLVPLPAPQA